MQTAEKLRKNGIVLSEDLMRELCARFGVTELAVFGSSLREDFTDSSDVDFLVSFRDDASVTLFDLMAMEEELQKTLHRKVDLVEKDALANPIRRKNILATSEVIYAAG